MSTSTAPWVKVLTIGFGRSSLDFALAVVTVTATVIAVLLDAPTMVRAPLAFVLVFGLPGYVLTVALFPAGDDVLASDDATDTETRGISTIDRTVLSVGLSLGLVVCTGLATELSPAPISTEPLVNAVAGLTLATIPVAFYRRRQVPSDARFEPFGASESGEAPGRGGHRRLHLLHIVVAASILFAVGAVAYAPGPGSADGGTTELYFQSNAADSAGEAAYPINMTRGSRETVTLGVGNHEGESISYAVAGQLRPIDNESAGSTELVRQRIPVQTVTVPAGERRAVTTSVTPQAAGRYRLSYDLYKESPPERPRPDDAYREVHLHIDVQKPASAGPGPER